MVNQDCLVPQAAQVSPVSLVSLVYQGRRENQGSQELDSRDLQEPKDSQVFLASQGLQEDQADQE